MTKTSNFQCARLGATKVGQCFRKKNLALARVGFGHPVFEFVSDFGF
jgi:hypothetical protein